MLHPRATGRVLVALAVALPLVLVPAPAQAAFPGGDGRLAFQREAPAGNLTQTDIYTARANGRDVRALTATAEQNEFGPAWNATGTTIAFWRTRAPFGPGSIWTMAADGSRQRRLTAGIDARDPAWNPTGTRIVFTLAEGGGMHLWTMRARDGGDRRQLTFGPGLDFEPAWSPDGTRIAFTRGSATGDPGDVYVLTLRTGAVRRLTADPAYDHQVAWSPDGRRIAFERDWAASSSIYTIDAGGSRARRLTTGAFFDIAPAYSPDGRLIAFGTDRGGAFLDDLWVMRADGRHARPLVTSPVSEGFPDWQPRR